MERARDLFEQALDGCPAEYAQSNFNFNVLNIHIYYWGNKGDLIQYICIHVHLHLSLSPPPPFSLFLLSLSLSPLSSPLSLSLSPHLDLYLLYAKLEEDYGLTRRAMSVYERATEAVLPEEQYDVCHVTITLLSCDYHVTLSLIRCSVYT